MKLYVHKFELAVVTPDEDPPDILLNTPDIDPKGQLKVLYYDYKLADTIGIEGTSVPAGVTKAMKW